MRGFDHQAIEREAQAKWESEGIHTTDLTDTTKDPYYLLFEFPYPSGDLHIGHWYAYALTDIFARFKRMEGKNVLFPIGFDAFGLPAENAAIKHGVDPREWTYKNMETMREQIRTMGTSIDWSKEVVTCDPEFYKWTQWLFLKLLEHKLVERKEAPVKWCPKDKTVLANEQVTDGHCERCGSEVEEKLLTQWFLKITDYAERLLNDLDPLPWREEIKDAQRAWIGKSEGAKLSFPIADTEHSIEIFTTRPDTVFGATYVVLAPEHPLLAELLPLVGNKQAVETYQKETKKKTERERSENKEKTGVVLEGVSAINPATKESIPVYVADYVLGSYGTGAVMAVPAHDERDFAFANKMGLPIKQVIAQRYIDHTNPHVEGAELVARDMTISVVHDPATDKYLTLRWKEQPWTTFVTGGVDDGEDPAVGARREIEEETGYSSLRLIKKLGHSQSEFYAAHKGVNRIARATTFLFELENSEQATISDDEAAKHEVVWQTKEEIEADGLQHAELAYIWNALFGTASADASDGILVNSGEFNGRNSEETKWDITEYAGGTRTTNYRIRDWLVSRQRYWGTPIPVVYDPEGNAHPVLSEHLPWTLPTDVDFSPNNDGSPLRTSKELKERVEKLYGAGWTPEYDTLDTFVDSSWYFYRYLDPKDDHDFSDQALMKTWLPVNRYSGGSEHTTMHLLYARFFHKALHDLALVPGAEPFVERFNRGLILGPDGAKMSKSKGNVVNPDEFVTKYGADAVRMYLAFIGPYNEPGNYPWSLSGVEGMRRFLERIATLSEKVEDATPTPALARALAKATLKVSEDIERFKFNTAISALMIFMNEFEASKNTPRTIYHGLLHLLAPLAPHLAEHLYAKTKGEESIHTKDWPVVDTELLAQSTKTVIVQVSGKKRGELSLPETATEEDAVAAAKTLQAVQNALAGAPIRKVVYVPGRILNFVI